MSEILSRKDLHDQVAWIEFTISSGSAGWRVEFPVSIFIPEDKQTWRILDQRGVVHIFPAPGVNGCVVRYEKVPGAEDPVEL